MSAQGGFLVSNIKQISNRLFDKILAEKGIEAFNGAQGRILYVLWQGDGIPIRDLSHETSLTMTTLTSMLDRMEHAGLIVRERNADDRRQVLVSLTAEARALEADYNEVTKRMEDVFYQGFNSEEIETFEASLRRVLANLEEAQTGR